MARSVKRARHEPQPIHELGVRGRKTGVVLQDHGTRDEHGMQPLDSIFSPLDGKTATHEVEPEDSGSDMEIASSNGPGPQTVLKNRHSIPQSVSSSKSPVKSHISVPAKESPYLNQGSSPSRSGVDDRDVTVTRKLDFTSNPNNPARRSIDRVSNGAGGYSRPSLRSVDENIADHGSGDIDSPLHAAMGNPSDPTMSDLVSQSMVMFDALQSDNFPEASPGQAPKNSPRVVSKAASESATLPLPGAPTSPNKSSAVSSPRKSQPLQSIYGTRKRPGQDSEVRDRAMDNSRRANTAQTSMPPPPRPATHASRSTSVKPEVTTQRRGRGRPRKTERPPKRNRDDEGEPGDEIFMEIQRGPPMPKSRGLVSLRSGSGTGGVNADRTRAGRNSSHQRAYHEWNEDLDAQDVTDLTSNRMSSGAHDAEPPEDWETDEGVISGEYLVWEPEHEKEPPGDEEEVRIAETRLAISADGIQTQVIPDATFRFAKTLTLPFLGAGVVDLPPGAEKRPKNSRKMHMVFFVHFGKVSVTINEVAFGISAGGTWFVPRGNYYSIVNEYKTPARIFFAQGCEFSESENPDEGHS